MRPTQSGTAEPTTWGTMACSSLVFNDALTGVVAILSNMSTEISNNFHRIDHHQRQG